MHLKSVDPVLKADVDALDGTPRLSNHSPFLRFDGLLDPVRLRQGKSGIYVCREHRRILELAL